MFRRRNRPDAVARRRPPAEIFLGLRGQILDLDPGAVGLEPTPDHPEVWGAMMEIGYPDATATLVGLADGTTSLYLSSGGGIIGGGEHAQVAAATREFIRAVTAHLPQMPSTPDTTLPAEGHVVLRALTYAGRRAVETAENDLGSGGHDLSPVFRAGHDVITQLRLIDEKRIT